MVRDARRRAPHHEGLRPHPEKHREAMRLEGWTAERQLSGSDRADFVEACCVSFMRPGIWRGSRTPRLSANVMAPCYRTRPDSRSTKISTSATALYSSAGISSPRFDFVKVRAQPTFFFFFLFL